MVVGKRKRQDAALRALLDGAPEPDVSKFADLVGDLSATREVEDRNELDLCESKFAKDLLVLVFRSCSRSLDSER